MPKKLAVILLGGLMIFSLFGCKKEPEVCGGIVDKTDKKAPTQISSHNIKTLAASFFIYNDIDYDLSGDYLFKIQDNKLIYKNTEVPISNEDLLKVDEIIRSEGLISKNGTDRITSGLPPEYQPCSLNITYDTSEEYHFRANNDPEASWSRKLFALFADVLNANGHSELMPKKEAFEIDRLQIFTKVKDESHYISTYIDGEETKIMVDNKKIELKDDTYAKLEKVIEEYDLGRLHTGELFVSGNANDFEYFYEICVDYKSGRQIYGYGEDTSIIEPAIPSIIEIFE